MFQRARSHLPLILVVLVATTLACSLSKASSPTATVSLKTMTPTLVSTEAATPTQAVQPSPIPSPLPTILQVQITNPAANAQLPADAPLQVQFAASGGPFIEIDLLVDGALTSKLNPLPPDAQLSGILQWDKPEPGPHQLSVMVLDQNKNFAQADVSVQVGADSGALKATTTSDSSTNTTGGMQMRFVNLVDGGSVEGDYDENGKPLVLVAVEASGAVAADIGLTVDGVPLRGIENQAGTDPFTAEFRWSPLGGGGEYTLVAAAASADKQAYATQAIHITVTGLPVFTPTPPPLDQAAANQRMTELYQQVFDLTVPAPSLIRFESSQPDYARWVSTAYLNGQRYEIDIFDDSHYETSVLPYADHGGTQDVYVLCRPAGIYKMLVVFVDYGNLGVTQDEALAQVPVVTAWLNQQYIDFAANQGLTSPILQIEASGAFLATPPTPGSFLQIDQIQALTGFDPAQFDFVAQIDLDSSQALPQAIGMDIAGGLALQGCGLPNKGGVNLWAIVNNRINLQGGLVTLFDHELSHLFGYMDGWPPHPAIMPDGVEGSSYIPAVLFGWTDTDGDGMVEIRDPTPYGTTGK